jgi:hypothetical protein
METTQIFRKLLNVFHPDKGHPNGHALTQRLLSLRTDKEAMINLAKRENVDLFPPDPNKILLQKMEELKKNFGNVFLPIPPWKNSKTKTHNIPQKGWWSYLKNDPEINGIIVKDGMIKKGINKGKKCFVIVNSEKMKMWKVRSDQSSFGTCYHTPFSEWVKAKEIYDKG